MNGKIFVDSNVLLYLVSSDLSKRLVAKSVLFSEPVISTQVISESMNVLFRKLGKSVQFATKYKSYVERFCRMIQIDGAILSQALVVKEKYGYQWYDCVILATALADNCETLYSEDMQHGQVIEERLTIVNPFLEQ